MDKKKINLKTSKTAEFAAATANTEIKTKADRPNFLIRALRWIFITVPRAVWNWICGIEIGGLCNLAMLLLIIVLFSILIGQVLNMGCGGRDAAKAPEIVSKARDNRDNVEVSNEAFAKTGAGQSATAEKETIVLPLKREPKVESIVSAPVPAPTVRTASDPCRAKAKLPLAQKVREIKIDGDMIVDGEIIGSKLGAMTAINGNLYLQNMRAFTLPCGTKINGSLIIRNVRQLRFCGSFVVNGNIYVSADSSFGPIPRSAKVRGQVIF